MNSILTPSGYKLISDIKVGDEVIAFDVNTGEEIINKVESKEIVTPNTYGVTDEETKEFIPDVLTSYIINGTWTLCKYQSIWVNDNIVKHASQLVVGDIVFNGSDNDVIVESIEETILDEWIRFEISGDHSFISDDLTLHNASRYWVGGTGNWDASTTTNWSSTSGGSGGSSVPTSADDVTFDNLSNATGYTVTITAVSNCNNLTINAPATGTLTYTGTSNQQIYGSTSMAAAGVSNTLNAIWYYLATSGTKTITSNGVSIILRPIFNGAGGTFQLADNLTFGGSNGIRMDLSAGTFDPNGKTVIINTSGGYFQITGSFTFYNLTRTGGANKVCSLILANDITVTNVLTINGNSSVNRMLVSAATYGTQVTITSASNSITNCDFQDIKGAGAGSWNLAAITGLSGDCGGNSGITFTTAATQTATGTASFSWSNAAIWTSRVPLPQDDVVVNNAFVAGRTVTMDMWRSGKSITFGCTGSPTVSISSSGVIFFGSLDLSGVGALSGTAYIDAMGRSSYTLNWNGLSHAGIIYIEAPTGTYTLASNMVTTSDFRINYGTFDTATYNVTCNVFVSSNTNTRTITVGTGTWTVTGNNTTVWNTQINTNLTYTTNPTINFNYSGATGTRTIIGGTGGDETDAKSININITAGTDTVSITRFAKSIDFTGFSGTWANVVAGSTLVLFGDIKISTGTTITASTGTLSFRGTGTQNITSNGKNFDMPISLTTGTPTVKLLDNLAIGTSTSRAFTLTSGTLNLNGFNITHYGNMTISANSLTKVIDLGSNTYNFTINSVSVFFNNISTGNFSVIGTGTIKVSGSTASIRTFDGGGATFPTLEYTNATAGGQLSIAGSNTFASIKCVDTNGQNIKFTAGTTQTITSASGVQLTGAAGNLIALDTITGTGTVTLSCPSNNVVTSYLSLTRCKATGGARWWAQNSTNVSGNNGWRFGQASNRQMSGIGSPTLII